MPKIRQVLTHVHVESGSRRRKCHRKASHSIPAGQPHLAIYDSTSGARKNYCRECARPILTQCLADLRRLEIELYGSSSVATRTAA